MQNWKTLPKIIRTVIAEQVIAIKRSTEKPVETCTSCGFKIRGSIEAHNAGQHHKSGKWGKCPRPAPYQGR